MLKMITHRCKRYLIFDFTHFSIQHRFTVLSKNVVITPDHHMITRTRPQINNNILVFFFFFLNCVLIVKTKGVYTSSVRKISVAVGQLPTHAHCDQLTRITKSTAPNVGACVPNFRAQ